MPQTMDGAAVLTGQMTTAPLRKRWTRDECRRLMEMEFLPAGKFELIEGDIVDKMGQNEPHVYVCMRVLQALLAIFGFEYVRFPAPVAINDINEPEPDVSVTIQTQRHFLVAGTPGPLDLRLAVEVSDSSLQNDLTFKASLYSRAGIAEYWVVDVNGRRLFAFSHPTPEGYATQMVYSEAEAVAPLSAPQAAIQIRELLP